MSSRFEPILRSLNILAIPFDMLPSTARRSGDLDGMYWYFGKRYLQAAVAMRSLRRPAAVFITSYGCGTDTMLIHLLRDALGGIPLLELEIDQHSDFTGVRTRLEAFFYSLRRNRQFNAAPARRRQHTPLHMKGRRILIPRMSDHADICAAALKSLGYGAEVMRPTGPRAMACGKAVVNGGECLPCTMLAGDMLDYLEHNGNGVPPAFFMISGDGPCRLGQYTYLLRKMLDESGHEEAPIVDMSQDTSFYNKLDIVSSEFKKRFWIGSVALDHLNACYHELRTQTRDRDRLDRVCHEALKAIGRSTGDSTAVREQLRRALTELNRVGVTTEPPDVTIAVVGENFVRCNPAANRQIVSVLEDMNAAVRVPHLTEWIYYTNWTARLHCRYERRFRRYARLTMIDWLQRLHAYRLRRGSSVGDRSAREPRLKDLFSLAADYVPRTFEGETIVSIGRTIDYYLKGIDGVIQVAPFGCMAGTIFETITPRLSEDLNGLPILNLQFDGRDDDIRRPDLQSFLSTVRNWKACRKERS